LTLDIECTEEEEVVARAIFGANSYPGRKLADVHWPPAQRNTLTHYLNLARAVIKALDDWKSEAS